ncbi:LysR family transcriptional regulator [Novosphingobium sp. SG707]|uniref:LysR substrate-binding domain-containing protein n=1 Tax=Novosphingobium sp. SG707 TaxID=2586996 RepID=UPI0014486EEA|nr:DNA-binding transcriptional LysR family regulator [Novosphingobium sp. SG707]
MRQIFSLRQIEGFLLASDLRSFTRAAEAMRISQSAFSQLIRELETRLEIRLFDRTTRSIALTNAGEVMYRKLSKCMSAIDEACEEARAIARAEHGHIVLGTVASIASGIVTRALGRLRAEHPGIRVTLTEGLNDDLMDKVAKGDLDLAVAAQVDKVLPISFRSLVEDELVVVLPGGHRMAGAKRLKWSDLDNENLVLAVRMSSTYEYISDKIGSHNINLGAEYQAASVFTALSMVRAGFGLSFIPGIILADLNLDGLSIVQIEDPPIRRIGICHSSDRGVSPAAHQFEIFLKAEIAAAQRNRPFTAHA